MSQWWANFYLDALDHHLKDHLGVKYYARYMDDFVLLADDKATLHRLKAAIEDFLADTLMLEFKARATFIAPVHQGIPFLGLRIFPNLIRLRHEKLVRFSRKLRNRERQYRMGRISEAAFIRSAVSMIGHLQHANTLQMRKNLFYPIEG